MKLFKFKTVAEKMPRAPGNEARQGVAASLETSKGKSASKSNPLDLLAVVLGTAAGALGGFQFFAPLVVSPLTGLESGIASQVVALQWLFFAGLLLLGGIFSLRVVTIFAAEFLMIGSCAALLVILMNDPQSFAIFIHAALAVLAFACSGFSRLSDKAELKRELRFEKERAKVLVQDSMQSAEKHTKDKGI